MRLGILKTTIIGIFYVDALHGTYAAFVEFDSWRGLWTFEIR